MYAFNVHIFVKECVKPNHILLESFQYTYHIIQPKSLLHKQHEWCNQYASIVSIYLSNYATYIIVT